MKRGDRVRVTFEGTVNTVEGGVLVLADGLRHSAFVPAAACELIAPPINVGDELDYDAAATLPTGSIVAWSIWAYVVRDGRLFVSVDGQIVHPGATRKFRVLHIEGRRP